MTAEFITKTSPGDGYMFQPEIERMDRASLEKLQLERLKATLRRAYDNVPHYRQAFDKAGVTPDHLKSLKDLAAFPFTVKTDLRDNYPFGLFAVPRTQVTRVHASSGTTGRPTVVGYTQGDLDRWADLVARSMASGGVRPGDIVHNAYGYGLFTGGLGAHAGIERLGATVIPMSGGSTERQVALLRDFGANALCATPSYALNIAEVAEAEKIDLRSGPLRIGMFGAEPWTDAMREELQTRLGITATDLYGLSEIMGPGVAVECAAHSGLHGWEDHFLFEVIDSQTGAPLPYGEAGELVITTLTKEALPMIRYRTRDITRLNIEPCVCGRSHVRIMRVTGRNDDMMIIRGVNVYPSQIESVMLPLPGISPHYQLVVERKGSMDVLTIDVEAEGDENESAYPGLAKSVAHHVKSLIGVTATVNIRRPGEIPRSLGKALRVRDLRKKA